MMDDNEPGEGIFTEESVKEFQDQAAARARRKMCDSPIVHEAAPADVFQYNPVPLHLSQLDAARAALEAIWKLLVCGNPQLDEEDDPVVLRQGKLDRAAGEINRLHHEERRLKETWEVIADVAIKLGWKSDDKKIMGTSFFLNPNDISYRWAGVWQTQDCGKHGVLVVPSYLPRRLFEILYEQAKANRQPEVDRLIEEIEQRKKDLERLAEEFERERRERQHVVEEIRDCNQRQHQTIAKLQKELREFQELPTETLSTHTPEYAIIDTLLVGIYDHLTKGGYNGIASHRFIKDVRNQVLIPRKKLELESSIKVSAPSIGLTTFTLGAFSGHVLNDNGQWRAFATCDDWKEEPKWHEANDAKQAEKWVKEFLLEAYVNATMKVGEL
jgi:hypothetical protein